NGFSDTYALTDTAPPHTSSPLAPAKYSITEQAVAGYTTGVFCTGGPFGAGASYTQGTQFALQAGQSVFCRFSNVQVRQAGQKFCAKSTVSDVLNPASARFKNNKGVDHVVLAHKGESIQAALDAIGDVNNDGYIIIGVVAADPVGGTSAYGGNTKQHFEIHKAYPLPLALLRFNLPRPHAD